MFFRTHDSMPKAKGTGEKPCEMAYYDVLHVSQSSNTSDIRKAFKSQSYACHPDRGGNTSDFQAVQRAHEVLSDDVLRACYDAYGARFEEVPNINVFKRRMKSPDVECRVSISIKDLMDQKEITVEFQRTVESSTVKDNYTIRLTPQTQTGRRPLRIPRKGHKQVGKGTGDLLVHLVLKPCPGFKVFNSCLIYNVQMDIMDFLMNTPFTIRHPSGDEFTVRPAFEPLNLSAPQMLVVEGRGLSQDHPMFVQVQLQAKAITANQRKKLAKIFKRKPIPTQPTDTVGSPITHEEVESKLNQTERTQETSHMNMNMNPNECVNQ
jgi:DnaJ-class molecular chaperone